MNICKGFAKNRDGVNWYNATSRVGTLIVTSWQTHSFRGEYMKFVAIMILLCSSLSFAKAEKADTLAAEFFSAQYQTRKVTALKGLLSFKKNSCDPDQPTGDKKACVDYVCSKMPSYNCDEVSEVTAIAASCRGTDVGCVKSVCSKMPSYNCDEADELKELAQSCRAVKSDCIDTICKKMPSYNCDEGSELTAIAAACRGTDSSCITDVCSRVPSYNCDEPSELIAIAESCGNY